MSIPSFSPVPYIPSRSAPEADFDAKMYELFVGIGVFRDELVDLIDYLQASSIVIGNALNGVTIGQVTPAAGKFTSLMADSLGGSAVQSDPTDATAGRALLNGGHGLGATDSCPTLSDTNATGAAAGLYRITTATANRPFDLGTVSVIRNGSTRITQMAQQVLASGAHGPMMYRHYFDGTWSAWSTVYSRQNILGTVSQSAGVPTGAVIERGSNASGRYVRFADGTQICRATVVPDYAAHNTRQQFSYPASFINTAEVWADYSIQGNGNTAAWDATDSLLVFGGLSAQQWEVVQRKSGQTGSYPINLIALGRWF